MSFQGLQTLAIPEVGASSGIATTRYEEKVLLEKTLEISAETVKSMTKGKGKEREKDSGTDSPNATMTTSEEPGIHMEKGLHGFEFAFIIPASSAPSERAKQGRLKYTLSATALGAGRGRSHITTNREIFIVVQVNSDGGPTPLDIQYHDIHDALGALSVSLTSASLTVGGAATLSIHHPSPPPGLSVHVVRVFMEQTVELYSEVRKGWIKMPTEKHRLWERGYMPYKDKSKQIDPASTIEDNLWIRAEDGVSHGRPGRGVTVAPTHAPFGATLTPSSGGPSTPAVDSPSHHPNNNPLEDHLTATQDGYKIRSVLRLPDDNVIRPSTVRGSRAEIRISHELGVEVFFSRASVLDEREASDSFGKPKVQVFSMRRSTIIPSCLATYDTIHLPPYSFESPVSSRPPSPTGFAPGSLGGAPRGRDTTKHQGNAVELEYWKLTQSLKAALPHASGGSSGGSGSGRIGSNGIHSAEESHSPSQSASRNSSPTRHQHHHGFFGRKSRNASPTGHGRKSRPASPTGGNHQSSSAGPISIASTHSPTLNRRNLPGMHAFTPSHHHHSNALPIVVTAPASGISTPKSLPANSPWAVSNLPPRSNTSHTTCQCGRSTEELIEAEHKLLEGAATAPGFFTNAHDEGQLPPAWTPSRPSSPTEEEVTGWIAAGANRDTISAERAGKTADYQSSSR